MHLTKVNLSIILMQDKYPYPASTDFHGVTMNPDNSMVVSRQGGGAVQQADNDLHLIELWLHGRSHHTKRAYLAEASRFLHFVGKPLPVVRLADLQAFTDTIEGEPTTKSRALAAVKSLLSFGHRLGYLTFDIGRAVKLPPLKNRLAEKILSEDEVHKMLALEPSKRNRAILRLLYSAGLRVSELCHLAWKDVQERKETAQITIYGKGSKTRFILLSEGTWKELNALRDGSDGEAFLFHSFNRRTSTNVNQDGRIDASQVLRIVRAAAMRAGITRPVSPHWLRHAHATHALDRGAPIHLVQATLGHSSTATTGKYLHARPEDSSSRYLGI